MTILWYILLFLLIIGLIIRFCNLRRKCPKCEEKKFDNFENSKPLLVCSEIEIYEINKRCSACGYIETWYLKRTFDREKTIDQYLTDKPDF